ncbi:MAG TPA: choice-of-anchor J domain-containing protein, partial [Flavisolibacter sp.]
SSVVPAWNTQLYLNIWVVNFGNSGVLGYSMLPGSFAPGDGRAGFVVDYRAFGSNAPYLFSGINQGKTAVHEIGHYFNLLHPWGDNNSGNPTCTLDDGCSDTPLSSGPNGGCPSGPVTNSCSPTAPGIMWQNHMDYSDDACMVLFTAQQTARMETALINAPDRNTLLSSNGCSPAVAPPNDASIDAIITPASGSATCSTSVAPVVRLKNIGSNTLTSATITVSINGAPQAPYLWTGSLAQNATTDITLPSITLPTGTNNITVTSSLPNGATDGDPTNDSKTAQVTLATATSLPLTETFESPAFPANQWTVLNPNGDFTWQKTSPGKNSASSMYINNYDTDGTNRIDDFRSRPISTSGVTSFVISFDLAHKNYPQNGYHDTLSVLVSSDCGATYQTVYKKWGTALATAGSSSAAYTSPASSDWRNEIVTVSGSILNAGQVIVVFRNTSRYGNNIYIDNINILVPGMRDMKLDAIVQPTALSCSNSIMPQVLVSNPGQETITSFSVGYSINGGSIVSQTVNQAVAPGQVVGVNLAGATANPGNNTIKIFTYDPVTATGTGDVNLLNDTLSVNFAIAGTAQAPLVEGFEGPAFPPANWAVVNADGAITWDKYTAGGNSSAYVNTFNYNATGQKDLLVSPMTSYTGVDSVKLTFDLAASPYRFAIGGGMMDTLEVLVSRDCGNTYTMVYQKYGVELSTTGTPSPAQFFPVAASDWRNETIDLTQYATQSPIMVVFRTTNTKENNIFIDNVNLYTRTLPARLKQNGYLVMPTIFQSSFLIWHYQQPTSLRNVNVYNSAGQLVWKREFSGNASRQLQVDMQPFASGIYMVQLLYTDGKKVVERVIKQN